MREPVYTIPGVYFETPKALDMRLRGVPLGVAGFIGYAAPRKIDARSGESIWPIMIENPEQIDEKIITPAWGLLRASLRGYFANGGTRAFVVGVPEDTVHSQYHVLGGGEPGNRWGLAAFDTTDDVELLVAPDTFVVPPGLEAPNLAHVLSVQQSILDFCRGDKLGETISRGGYFAVLDAPPGLDQEQILRYHAILKTHPAAGYGALFYPWIDLPTRDERLFRMPPCGQVAGIMSRQSAPPQGRPPGTVTTMSGPHISPANEVIIDAVGAEVEVQRRISRELLEAGVNCICPWPGRGMVIWGTRTMAPEEEWNHIVVRRIMSYVQRSVYVGTQWAVFEPNSPTLWKQLEAQIGTFLEDLWKQGILVGESAGEAFIVRCDEELNPPLDRDEGRLNVMLLVKPVRSVEYIVLRITHEGGAPAGGA